MFSLLCGGNIIFNVYRYTCDKKNQSEDRTETAEISHEPLKAEQNREHSQDSIGRVGSLQVVVPVGTELSKPTGSPQLSIEPIVIQPIPVWRSVDGQGGPLPQTSASYNLGVHNPLPQDTQQPR